MRISRRLVTLVSPYWLLAFSLVRQGVILILNSMISLCLSISQGNFVWFLMPFMAFYLIIFTVKNYLWRSRWFLCFSCLIFESSWTPTMFLGLFSLFSFFVIWQFSLWAKKWLIHSLKHPPPPKQKKNPQTIIFVWIPHEIG